MSLDGYILPPKYQLQGATVGDKSASLSCLRVSQRQLVVTAALRPALAGLAFLMDDPQSSDNVADGTKFLHTMHHFIETHVPRISESEKIWQK